MRPEFRTATLIAAALGLLVSLFVALRSGGDDKPAPTTMEAATTAPATTEAATTTTAPPAAVSRGLDVVISVSGGKPEGGVARFSVEKGTKVALEVRSDVADEVHVHGYDLTALVTAGGRARITFTADLVGRFEIELEDAHELIGELTVSP